MKNRIYLVSIIIAFMLLLSACAQSTPAEEEQSAPTWQEQYDLGVRYLSEGNYEEAILAFTAAIEIDPKQAPAYVGRGDAYVGSGETEENLAAALADYEKAVELDETNAEAYLGLADVYIRQGEYDKALEILRRGLETTGSQTLEDKLSELEVDEVQAEDADQSLGTISIGGSGRNMLLSLTLPDLPEEVWVGQQNGQTMFAWFDLSVSDGQSTIAITTGIHPESTENRMMPIPNGEDCRNTLMVATHGNDGGFLSWLHTDTPVTATREGNTITWSFIMPDAGFQVSDITYAGYHVGYFPSSESERVNKQATFEVRQGVPTYLNDGKLEDMGFLISGEQFHKLYK